MKDGAHTKDLPTFEEQFDIFGQVAVTLLVLFLEAIFLSVIFLLVPSLSSADGDIGAILLGGALIVALLAGMKYREIERQKYEAAVAELSAIDDDQYQHFVDLINGRK